MVFGLIFVPVLLHCCNTALGSCDVHTQVQPKADNVVPPSEARTDLVGGAQGCLLNGESYLTFAIKPNIETETCRRQKDLLKARVAKVSLG